jgi:hypothetical protein
MVSNTSSVSVNRSHRDRPPARLAISFKRFVAASARANNRSVATAGDVEEAMNFIAAKLAFYSLVTPLDGGARASRDEFYRQHWDGTASPEDLAKQYAAATGEAVSDRTVRRDLRRLGAKRVRHGMYLLPPSQK